MVGSVYVIGALYQWSVSRKVSYAVAINDGSGISIDLLRCEKVIVAC